jgi:phosphatidate cytidylyltransferase
LVISDVLNSLNLTLNI